MRGFVKYLKEEKLPWATGRFALGRENFAKMLREGELITQSPEEVLRIGLAELKRERGQFAETAAKPSACRMVTWSAFHCGSSGSGSRTARKPHPVRISWLPSCMWQVWQVGAAEVSLWILSCFSSLRTPYLEEAYISHWGCWDPPRHAS